MAGLKAMALKTLDDARQLERGVELEPWGLSYPYHWQLPAATEKAAYEALAGLQGEAECIYLAVPWATLIDGLRGGSRNAGEILTALREARERIHRRAIAAKVITVAQHIHAARFIDVFVAAGVTDMFWSHAVVGQEVLSGVHIHPFPLYPAQAPVYQPSEASPENRTWLANFIGAYSPGLYLSNVRDLIYADAGRWNDVKIVRRDSWHFDRAVYEEQVKGLKPSQDLVAREQQMAEEYLDAIRRSWFTLCPTGSGPNSIRIFECLALGSIPIILTRTLRLAGPPELWHRAAIVEEDEESGYQRALERARATSIAERQRMILEAQKLAQQVLPSGYRQLIGQQFYARPHEN